MVRQLQSGGRPSLCVAFRSVSSEADAVAKELSVLLKRRLAERKDDTEQVVLLLRRLGEPDDSLQVPLGAGPPRRPRAASQLPRASCASAVTAAWLPGSHMASLSTCDCLALPTCRTSTCKEDLSGCSAS